MLLPVRIVVDQCTLLRVQGLTGSVSLNHLPNTHVDRPRAMGRNDLHSPPWPVTIVDTSSISAQCRRSCRSRSWRDASSSTGRRRSVHTAPRQTPSSQHDHFPCVRHKWTGPLSVYCERITPLGFSPQQHLVRYTAPCNNGGQCALSPERHTRSRPSDSFLSSCEGPGWARLGWKGLQEWALLEAVPWLSWLPQKPASGALHTNKQ